LLKQGAFSDRPRFVSDRIQLIALGDIAGEMPPLKHICIPFLDGRSTAKQALEQDHQTIKRRSAPASISVRFQALGAQLPGYEAIHMTRKESAFQFRNLG
jgi:transposase-like protein